VQRQRRGQDNGIPVLKRAMELKKKKNLEFMQGNPFVTLQPKNLTQIVVDVNLKLGANCAESEYIINNLVVEEQKYFDEFVEENPESLLPTELYLEFDMRVVDKEDGNVGKNKSHVPSFKDDASPPSGLRWLGRGKLRIDLTESNMMIEGFWNIRGLGKPGRTGALSDFIKENKLDFVGVQETKK
jgi:hypothetical protein